jgi:type II secretory pathway component PulJ
VNLSLNKSRTFLQEAKSTQKRNFILALHRFLVGGVFRKVRDKSITLLELLIALAILSAVVMGLYSIEIFSRNQLRAVDRRAKLQIEVSYVLEHMAKNINRAIGDATNPPTSYAVANATIGPDPAVTIWIDYNNNSKRDSAPEDRQIAYRYQTASSEARYYPDYSGSPASNETIGKSISVFGWSLTSNYLFVNVTACWDPASSSTCGTPNNPAVTMKSRIDLPAVSTH